ncbi:hypothetical protein BDV40DRAFT_298851 [Aspergillus tamarii]|uniref:Dickkopf N-terminal cysteine-rich domain-containing protein n=1 Tax=Aspergillus tamarii TaxID=41984 RepID=A0A5N6UZT7_ASPTM|nr:hypothetical protein BDV40DRAFT_298851 [Aspergillus tamarii]
MFTMMLYMIYLLFLCNLVASLDPAPNVQDDGAQLPPLANPAEASTTKTPQGLNIISEQTNVSVSETWTALSAFIAIWDTASELHAIASKELSVTISKASTAFHLVPFFEGRGNQKLTSSPVLQLASVEPALIVPPGTTAGVEAAFRSRVPVRSHSSMETTMVKDSPFADAQRCKHVTDCPQGKWCMDGFCWPFDQSTKLEARDADKLETSDSLRTQQRCHLHVNCGPTGLCIHGWCQYVSNAMSQDNAESVGVSNEATEERDMVGPRKCTSDWECYPRALCVND